MGILKWLRDRRARRERTRRARRLLDDAIRSGEILRGTSLRRHHAARCVLIDCDDEDGEIVRVRFGIVRHPRPYAFSRQSHAVIEYWLWDRAAGTLEVEKGLNLTRRRGEDSAD